MFKKISKKVFCLLCAILFFSNAFAQSASELEKLENKLDKWEDKLENKFGLDD